MHQQQPIFSPLSLRLKVLKGEVQEHLVTLLTLHLQPTVSVLQQQTKLLDLLEHKNVKFFLDLLFKVILYEALKLLSCVKKFQSIIKTVAKCLRKRASKD